ncbi:hypothetical protein SDRG_02327 [Saprolegnia diclina VS20]|uniref:RING-type E3 ubiquitin transferase n=1 Tax=Saprolegnia diclina (strain VS20) TaxID=1156394 RepID=T0R0F8_SAPDV|nr:hypothetical protein SDRG_02327 [Saprolegnia diclina VS20]EQC40431.1 hypothetical protein SDRG_02327 [Saprolegnia diclina VS20]|eukprot:XP_008606130.1 hypothetical protein SDRG_02327 [Saprolegnia diclina VS20]
MATPVAEQQGPPSTAPRLADVFRAREACFKGLVQQKNKEAETLRRQLIESNMEVERLKIQVLAHERALAEARSARRDETEAMVELDDDHGLEAPSPTPSDRDDRCDGIADEALRYDPHEVQMEREDEQAAPAHDALTTPRHDDISDEEAYEQGFAPMESGDDASSDNGDFEFGAPELLPLQEQGLFASSASINSSSVIIPVRRVLYRHELRNAQVSPPHRPPTQPTARTPQREAPPAEGQPRAQRPRTELIGIPQPEFALLSAEQRRAARAFSHLTRDPTISTNVAATLLAPIRRRSQGPVVHALPLPPLRRKKVPGAPTRRVLSEDDTNQRRLLRLQFYRNKEMVDAFEAYKRQELMTARRISPQHLGATREKFADDFPAVTDFMWQFMASQTWPQHTALQLECSICTEVYSAGETVATLPCAHLFHDDCIKPWFAEHDKCPQCKTLIVPTRGTLGKRP